MRRERNFILIGGAPTTGKSTITENLAESLSLPWISTDQIRNVIKPYGDQEKFPALYDTVGLTAEEFLAKYTPQQVSDMEYSQGGEVWPAIKGLFMSNSNWRDGGVIEGVNILPHLVAEENYKNKELVKPLFIVDLDEDRIREVVYTRGVYGGADEYSDDVKEKEVEWVMIFAHRLQEEAHKYGFPCIEVTKTDSDLQKVMSELGV